jgi:HK97 family phage major capsid protein
MPKTIPAATTAEELREILTDKHAMADLLKDPKEFADFVENSVNARLSKDPAISDQVHEQTENFMINWLRDNGMDAATKSRLNLDNANDRGPVRRPNTIYNKKAVGAAHDNMFNSATDFFHLISDHSFKDSAASAKLGTLQNAMSSIKPSDGGFLIPEILRAELLRVALERAIVRSRARVIPMDSLTVPFPSIDSTSNVSSVYGGVVGYWTEEGATLTESRPRFGRVELRAQKLTLYTEVPNELFQDSIISLEAFINEIFPEALAWFEDVAFFVGNGTGEPLGFLNAPAMVSVDRVGSSSGTVTWADVVGVYCRMLPQSLDRAVWVISPDTVQALLQMPFTAGGTQPILLGGGGFGNGGQDNAYPLSILGRPVIVSEKARALGTNGDINFVDFGFYLVGDRQAMSARQSEDFRFNQDVTAFRVIERVDGRPWLTSAITPRNGSTNTLSPYVNLTTA